MPTLAQVMQAEAEASVFRASEAWRLRGEDVVAVRLATGAPCAGHSTMFESWPGPESHVARWFRLASGDAVGVTDPTHGPQQVHLWKMASDRA